ncbi:porin [Paraburkholderia hospita]|uniref:Porin n=1 Tax=Paraburkholderia hospita TaxID=169430 RepID=A0AAN1JCL7_9BURK|nr:porin [Paraburkholderia hospita]AUT71250.1 porin [Paraburkholderia hospita]EIM95997.1 Porin [Paraburkholderia hospita]OUL87446.1 porin [Paraburkholderia hospita]SEI15980.1 porin, GBP family [Paraburkholderia hospita]
MKRIAFITASCCVSIAAHAQSSVTLYGILDNGISYVSNQRTAPNVGHSAWMASTGNIVGDRWGLTGTEDLGGGLKTLFKIENGYSGQNGKLQQGGRLFGRQAWVGVSSSQAGTVTLGRQYDSVVDYLGPRSLAQTFYGGLEFAHPFDNDNISDFFRLSNSIKYASVDYQGLKFGGLYAFSNQASGFAVNRAYSAGATYKNGPVSLSAAYMQLDQPGNGATGALDGSTASGDATFHGSKQRVWGAGASYALGAANFGFVWTQTTVADATGVNIGSSLAPAQTGTPTNLRFVNYEINASYLITPSWGISGSYTFTDGRYSNAAISAKPRWSQFNLLTAYALSKRTDVYLMCEYQHVTGATGTIFSGAFIEGSGGASATNKQFLASAGLRVRF